MRFLLERSRERLEAAGRARAAGNPAAARGHYLKSAEFLFQAAQRSQGTLRRIRLARARELFAAGRAIGASASAVSAKVSPADLPEDRKTFLLKERPPVGFGAVAGLEDAKEEIRIRLIYPVKYPDRARRYGMRCGGGVLLYGPPGTGKTLLARAVAGEIEAPFFTAGPSEVMSKWVGEAEQNVRRLFEEAGRCGQAIVFLDEVEALIPARRSHGSDVMGRVVPQFLEELQGIRGHPGEILFVGATNAPWEIDPAALRPGRLDVKVYVGLPDRPARRKILEIHLAGRPRAPDVDLEGLADSLAGYSGADIEEICRRSAARAFVESIRGSADREIHMADLLGVLAEIRPSVTSAQEQMYRRWARGG